MLGYNQIRGKGCTYESYRKDDIEPTLEDAIKMGFTSEQEKNFRTHIAQLCKYYLFDAGDEESILRFGKGYEAFRETILSSMK